MVAEDELRSVFDESRDGSLILRVRAQPGAATTEIVGVQGDALKIRVHAVADRGRANAELVRFLAETLGVRRDDVQLLSGATNRAKRFALRGTDLTAALGRLRPREEP